MFIVLTLPEYKWRPLLPMFKFFYRYSLRVSIT